MMQTVSIKLGENELVLETGKMAKQANGAVFAKYGGSAVLATACLSQNKIEDLDYVPLMVEYNEKFYAAGKIPGGFLKREGRPSNKEILVSRLIDRPLRPLFPKNIKREIQVVPTTISTDQINPPDVIGMVASATAVFLSDIPFAGPVGAVRVAALEEGLVINPTFDQLINCKLDIVVAGTEKGITMVEGGGREVSEDVLLEAIELAHTKIKEICELQHKFREMAGKPKIELDPEEDVIDFKEELHSFAFSRLETANFVLGKENRANAIRKIYDDAMEKFEEKIPEGKEKAVNALLEEMESKIVRESILKKKKRTDGRSPDDIRQITCEIDMLPRTHGSALFTRGETQALVVTTLGSVDDEKILDNIDGDARKTFMLHYNFPPFSVGETGRLATGRREIGHGHLAERAIASVLPSNDVFPYTIRIVSEILESNGSSSMATVCGSTLSLLNAGVPVKKSVAGIAMGLIKEGDDYVVLKDILGEEDHLGDMDFKVAGTDEGITAFQMDIKIDSVDPAILRDAVYKAKEGRMHILKIMNETIEKPRENLSDFAPKILTMMINPDKIGLIIGPGGKNIKALSEKFDSSINIENDGKVTIYCKNQEGAENTRNTIAAMVEEPEIGKVYTGTVKRIMDFGAFVEFLPGKEGLCHISKLAATHVKEVRDVVNEGDELVVKIVEIDRQGRVNLSTLEALENKKSSGSGGRSYRDRDRDSRDRDRNHSHDKRSDNRDYKNRNRR
ncbi:MAG: polyribonucleotide nucleotidyltransferase [Spirochaetales bacterium]|nr:polyribonucleotide nucleotidyltransferase [Spirochaetales bacterium]